MSTIEGYLKKLNDPLQEVGLIRNGLKTSFIESYLEKQDLPIKEILERLQISASTYFAKKRNHKPLDAYASEKFLRLISIIKLASEILGKEEAKGWLYKKIPSLGNEIPLNLLDTEIGHRLVEQALLQIKYGIYG